MIFLLRRIQEHRPVVVLIVLIALSLLSLVTETKASLLRGAIERVAKVTAYPFLKGGDLVSRSTSYVYHFVTDHGRAFDENAELRQENGRLKARLAEYTGLRSENARLHKILDFMEERPEFDVMPAKVIQSSMGMLAIDRGRVHGLKAPMPVVTTDGVVGIIIEVGDFTSKVATLHHRECRVGAMVRRNRLRAYDGMIAYHETYRVLCNMIYIDVNSDVRAGDEIVTSPESIFPAGFPIGVITGPPRGPETLRREADVKPYVDPYRLDEVLILVRAATDAESLTPVDEEEATLPTAVIKPPVPEANAVPDMRPLQEQFAP